jgi:hypothetical protein
MPMMTHKLSRLTRWSLLLGVTLLSACGGGGPAVSLGGKVYGLLPGSQLSLTEGDFRIEVTNPTYQWDTGRIFSFGPGFVPGAAYSLTIIRQPTNQLCRITRNGTGVLNVSQSDVRIDCHRTVMNDTGIRSTDPQINASPGVAPDAMVGRDAESALLNKIGAGAYGFDFTKICLSGDPVTAGGGCPAGSFFGEPNVWACTRDNVTGLVWRIRDLGDFDPAAGAPANGYCGQSGWRSPRVRELLSLVHAGKPNPADPAIDLDFFPDTPPEAFLAAEVYPDGTGSSWWIVNFGQRGASTIETSGVRSIQRWVASRGASTLEDTPSSAYVRIDAGNYAVVEMPHELAWLVPKVVPPGVDWDRALASVTDVNSAAIGGHADWRLPNRAELEMLVQRGQDAPVPALAPSIVGDDPAGFSQVFWTASPSLSDLSKVWVIDLTRGDLSLALKSGPGASPDGAGVIYVRNKASGPPAP